MMNSSVTTAYEFAKQAHEGQYRKFGENPEPYFSHIERVLGQLHEWEAQNMYGLDPTMVMVALLHDVVEDTENTLEDIANHFGYDVAVGVNWLTQPEKGNYKTRDEHVMAYANQLSEAPEEIQVIKAADICANSQDAKDGETWWKYRFISEKDHFIRKMGKLPDRIRNETVNQLENNPFGG